MAKCKEDAYAVVENITSILRDLIEAGSKYKNWTISWEIEETGNYMIVGKTLSKE